MKTIEGIMNAAIKQEKIERQQAEKEVKDENLEAIIEYFGNNAGLEKVVSSFGVDYESLSADATNGLLCVLYDANKQWKDAPCDSEGPTPEQEENMDNILMTTACDLVRYFKQKGINYVL